MGYFADLKQGDFNESTQSDLKGGKTILINFSPYGHPQQKIGNSL